MEDLYALITRHLRERGQTVTDFAERIGTSRQVMRRWRTAFPDSDKLRATATELGLPYGVVLVAALHGAGYAQTLGDVLAGQQVWMVGSAAVFADEDAAIEYCRVVEAVGGQIGADPGAVVIDGTAAPDHVRVYCTVWDYQWGIEQEQLIRGSVPEHLRARPVSDVRATQLRELQGIYRLSVDSLDRDVGRQVIESTRDRLTLQGRILPPHINIGDHESSFATFDFLTLELSE